MTLWALCSEMEALLKRELGTSVLKSSGHSGGGCISEGQSFDTDTGRVFVKINHKSEVRAHTSHTWARRAGFVLQSCNGIASLQYKTSAYFICVISFGIIWFVRLLYSWVHYIYITERKFLLSYFLSLQFSGQNTNGFSLHNKYIHGQYIFVTVIILLL